MASEPITRQSAPVGDRAKSPPTGGFSLLRTEVARNKLVLIFCLLGFIAIAANVKLILDLRLEMAGKQIVDATHPLAGQGNSTNRNSDLSESFKNRLSVLLGIIVVCFGAMIYLFVNRIIMPLSAVKKAAKEMAEGNLSVSAPSNPDGELGELGDVINNLAANFQEVLLLTGTTIGNSASLVDRIERALEKQGVSGNDLVQQVSQLRRDLNMLGSVVHDFQYYQTHFDGKKVTPLREGKDSQETDTKDAH